MKKTLIKSTIYTLAMRFICTLILIISITNENKWQYWEIASICLIIAVLCVLAPMYFFVKGKTNDPWIGMLATFVSHAVFTLIACIIYRWIFKNDWAIFAYYILEIFMAVFILSILLFEAVYIVVNILHKVMSKKSNI